MTTYTSQERQIFLYSNYEYLPYTNGFPNMDSENFYRDYTTEMRYKIGNHPCVIDHISSQFIDPLVIKKTFSVKRHTYINDFTTDVAYNFSLTSSDNRKIKYVTLDFNGQETSPSSDFENLPWFDQSNPFFSRAIPFYTIRLNVYCLEGVDNINLFADHEILSSKFSHFSGLKYDGLDVVFAGGLKLSDKTFSTNR